MITLWRLIFLLPHEMCRMFLHVRANINVSLCRNWIWPPQSHLQVNKHLLRICCEFAVNLLISCCTTTHSKGPPRPRSLPGRTISATRWPPGSSFIKRAKPSGSWYNYTPPRVFFFVFFLLQGPRSSEDPSARPKKLNAQKWKMHKIQFTVKVQLCFLKRQC